LLPDSAKSILRSLPHWGHQTSHVCRHPWASSCIRTFQQLLHPRCVHTSCDSIILHWGQLSVNVMRLSTRRGRASRWPGWSDGLRHRSAGTGRLARPVGRRCPAVLDADGPVSQHDALRQCDALARRGSARMATMPPAVTPHPLHRRSGWSMVRTRARMSRTRGIDGTWVVRWHVDHPVARPSSVNSARGRTWRGSASLLTLPTTVNGASWWGTVQTHLTVDPWPPPGFRNFSRDMLLSVASRQTGCHRQFHSDRRWVLDGRCGRSSVRVRRRPVCRISCRKSVERSHRFHGRDQDRPRYWLAASDGAQANRAPRVVRTTASITCIPFRDRR